jgi:hypothetical protein
VLATDRLRVTPWDLDGGFMEDSAPCEHPADTIGWDLFRISNCYSRLPLFDRMVGHALWRERYLQQVRAFVDGPFSVDQYAARVQAIVDQLGPALAEDPNRRGDDAEWRAALADLLDRQSRRAAFVRGQLESEGF